MLFRSALSTSGGFTLASAIKNISDSLSGGFTNGVTMVDNGNYSGIKSLQFLVNDGLSLQQSYNTTTGSGVLRFSVNTASTSQAGIVQLSDSLTSTSQTTALTSKGAKDLKDELNNKINGVSIKGDEYKYLDFAQDESKTIDVSYVMSTGANPIFVSKYGLNIANTKTALGLGSASYLNVGTNEGDIPLLGAEDRKSVV